MGWGRLHFLGVGLGGGGVITSYGYQPTTLEKNGPEGAEENIVRTDALGEGVGGSTGRGTLLLRHQLF